jgi:hypothetical protein
MRARHDLPVSRDLPAPDDVTTPSDLPAPGARTAKARGIGAAIVVGLGVIAQAVVALGGDSAVGDRVASLTNRPARTAQVASSADRHVVLQRYDSLTAFRTGHWHGVRATTAGALAISADSPRVRTYTDGLGSYPVTRRYVYGFWSSSVRRLPFKATQAIVSWNVTTPTGTWIETRLRGRHVDGTWTKWFVMGRWTARNGFKYGDIHRTSVTGQGNADGTVATDTLTVAAGRGLVAYQTRATLLRPAGAPTPTIRAVSTMLSREPVGHPEPTSKFTLGKKVELAVPRYSQEIHTGEYPRYDGGGEAWCSPTSTTMVQYFFGRSHYVSAHALARIRAPHGDPQVDYAAAGTYDYTFAGTGNWPFNAAYAARFHLSTFVTRLRSLAEAERFIKSGIPVVASLSFTRAEMPEAGYSTNGHLLVLVGFTAKGDPIINDPAASTDSGVRRVYTRRNFEKVWLGHTGGVAYIFHPSSVALPKNVSTEHNW